MTVHAESCLGVTPAMFGGPCGAGEETSGPPVPPLRMLFNAGLQSVAKTGGNSLRNEPLTILVHSGENTIQSYVVDKLANGDR